MECRSKNDERETLTPQFLITFKHLTSDAGTENTKERNSDVQHMNTYQIIPGIMYTLLARLRGVVWGTILNKSAAIKAINFVARYCYATRAQPFNTMHGSCTKYGIKTKLYLNQCKGEDEAIPVTVLLVAMYNAYYTFQERQQEKIAIIGSQTIRPVWRGYCRQITKCNPK